VALQVWDHFEVNGKESNLTAAPAPAISTHGAFYYNKTPALNPWPHWAGGPYNDTTVTVFLGGQSDGALQVVAKNCAAAGCAAPALATAENREGMLLWSDAATWTGAKLPKTVPKEVRGSLSICGQHAQTQLRNEHVLRRCSLMHR
jgi:hypothetical protein